MSQKSMASQKSAASQKSMSSFHGDPETEENIEKIFEGPVKFYLPDTSVECSPQHHHYDEKDYKSKKIKSEILYLLEFAQNL